MIKNTLLIILISQLLLGQNKTIVSLENGNYWVYSLKYYGSIFGPGDYTGLVKRKIIGDTVLNNVNCKKVEINNYSIRPTNYTSNVYKNVSYEYWHSDSLVYSKYNGSAFDAYYDARIKKDTSYEYQAVWKQIILNSEIIYGESVKTQRLRREFIDSSFDEATFAEKYGLLRTYNYARHTGNTQTNYLGAKIDNNYYGECRFIALTGISIIDRILRVNFELMKEDDQIDKILIYSKAYNAQNYTLMDSVYTTEPHLKKIFERGSYNLKLSYKTKSGIESKLTDNIAINVDPIWPLLITNCKITGRTVHLDFKKDRSDIQIDKILVYNFNQQTLNFEVIRIVNTKDPAIDISLEPGMYSLKFSYVNQEGNESLLTSVALSTYIEAEPIAFAFTIKNYNVNDNILNVEFEVASSAASIEKIFIYNYNDINKKYELYDSVNTNTPHLQITMPTGNYSLKFSCKDKNGLESELSQEIKFFAGVINDYALFQNYPNPFNPNTKISYSLSQQSVVSIVVYDVLGRIISTLVNEEKPKGNYSIDFDGSGLSSGIYYYQMKVNDFVDTRKMMLLR